VKKISKDSISAEGIYFSLPTDWRDTTDAIFEEGGHYTEAFLAIGLNAVEHEVAMDVEEYMTHFCNGMAKSEAYWMRWFRARVNLPSKEVNTKLFELAMNRMFDWSKKMDKIKPKDESKQKFMESAKEQYKKKYLQAN
jgi:hypothetical protein